MKKLNVITSLVFLLVVALAVGIGTAAEQKETAASKTNADSVGYTKEIQWDQLTILRQAFVSSVDEGNRDNVVLAYAEEIKFAPFPVDFKKYEVYPWDILKLPEFREPYFRILTGRTDIKWLKTLSGPSELNKLVSTQSGAFVVIKSCKQHWCDTHNIIIFFDPVSKKCWALLKENKQSSWLGNPNNELKELLQKVYRVMYPKL